MVTQLSLLEEVPPKHTVKRRPHAMVVTPVDRILVDLAPFLSAESVPRHHKGCVEIPLVRGHGLEKALRKLGFKVHPRPFDWVKPAKVKGAPKAKQVEIEEPAVALRYWRLESTSGRASK